MSRNQPHSAIRVGRHLSHERLETRQLLCGDVVGESVAGGLAQTAAEEMPAIVRQESTSSERVAEAAGEDRSATNPWNSYDQEVLGDLTMYGPFVSKNGAGNNQQQSQSGGSVDPLSNPELFDEVWRDYETERSRNE